MKKKTWNLQLVGVGILVSVVIGMFVKMHLDDVPPPPADAHLTNYNINLLNEEAASPGKVVRAIKDGHVVGNYTCTAQDAAIAWFFDESTGAPNPWARPGSNLSVQLNPLPKILIATDENKRVIPFFVSQTGPIIRVIFPRGYASKPTAVYVTVSTGTSTIGTTASIRNIKLTQFAEPVRCLQPPRSSNLGKAESLFTAVSDGFATQIEQVHPADALWSQPQEFLDFRIQSSSYCPEGPAEARFYGADAHEVKVQVDRYKRVDSIVNLSYKNAQIAVVDGIRTLRFPTTQDVGFILDAKAVVAKYIPLPSPGADSFRGDLIIGLERKPHPKVKFGPKASLDFIYPPIDSLGLDLLRFQFGNLGYGEEIKGHGTKNRASITIIPDLKIGIRIRTLVEISTASFVVPVQKQAKPEPNKPVTDEKDRLRWVDVYLTDENKQT